MKKHITKKWWLLIGLLNIPVVFILLISIIGMLLAFKNNNFSFDLISYWKNTFNNWYYWLLSLLLSIIAYLYYGYKMCFNKKQEASLKATKQKDYGNANWLNSKEINHLYPLVNNSTHNYHGFVVNTKKTRNTIFYNLRSNTHSLVIGGTGSGKTQGLVLPTINANSKSQIKPSMIITDVKGELYQSQGKLLQEQDYNIKILNLRNILESIAWNPLKNIYDQFKLMLISNDEQNKLRLRALIQSDIQDLSRTFFINKHQTDPFWNDSGALITEAIILGILEKTEMLINKHQLEKTEKVINALLKIYLPVNKFNLSSVAVIAALGKDLIEWFKSFPDTSIAKITANQVLQSGSKTLASILMTMSTNLAIFKNDFIRNLTCNNDLDFNEFIYQPTALFIVVPDENHNYYIFVTLLISQLYKFLVNQANKNNSNKLVRPVYFLCDEFGNLPAIPNIETMITIARSRNIFFQLILQDLQQLKEKYGPEKANIIFTNCNLHIFLQTMDLETAEKYSKMIGNKTVLQVSTNGKDKAINHSETLKGHALISASDLMKLSVNQAIVFFAKENPFKANLIPWYQITTNKSQFIYNNSKLKLINFNKNYYYDIKKNI